MSETLILTRSDIERVTRPHAVLDSLREGFAAIAGRAGAGGNRFPVPLAPPAPEGASGMLLAPGMLPDIPAYTVKVHAKFPGAQPALKGVILLHAMGDGRLLASLAVVTGARNFDQISVKAMAPAKTENTTDAMRRYSWEEMLAKLDSA